MATPITTPTPRNRPLATSRHDEILKRIAVAGAISVSELTGLFGVSRETIRRDLRFLAQQGRLDVVHGGAARREASEPALDLRASENAQGKAAIGRLAATFVEDGMVVLLDSGTTTLAVARVLVARRNLTVCTGSLAIAQLLCRVPGTRVHMLGGEIDPNDEATFGIDTLEAIGRFRVDAAFIGVGGLSDDGEITDYSRIGAEQRGRMIAAARAAYFVVDHTKFGRLTPVRIPNSRGAAGIVADLPPPAGTLSALADRGSRLFVAAP
ncbi:DeoR/GlpR family DNA-binding transcription regulator [Acidiphilium iwatense]|uniref:DeoR/GlpR family DNA-binding transcription regulator n=1 Tax=Acidiphilium iwatense TaxID=768198 RepID=A0ABS9DZM3_9PROT|nr:DeoR/GlpR family DNA-binding transcription regulator [Acidiphilium iwatense]MCF3948216.1 DeoR/GlpR family DNA-binding transcription regulator [Acidiphilium iwatense]